MKKNSGTDNVTNISDARERRENRDQGDVARLEAHGPTDVKVDGTADDWLITGCDGDQVYIYLAVKKTKRSKTFTVTEVYPGLLKKRTALREAHHRDQSFVDEHVLVAAIEQMGLAIAGAP